MVIYIVKHKGATIWCNMDFNEVTFSKGTEILNKFLVGGFFFRKKDAKYYIEHQKNYPEFFEIISVELPKSKDDNRKRYDKK